MRKGFTLVELLAAIAILGVIVVIAVPVVLNVIDDAEQESFKTNAYGIIRTARLNYNIDFVDIVKNGIIFTYEDGKEQSSIDGKKLGYDGKKPKDGSVVIDNYGKVSIALHDGKYCAYKGFDESLITVQKLSKEECEEKVSILYTDEACFTFDKETGTIQDYNFKDCPTDVVIPEKIDNVMVEHIGPGAFTFHEGQYCLYYVDGKKYYDDVDPYYIHEKDDGYEECYFSTDWDKEYYITSVILPKNLKTISYYAFYENELKELIIPGSVTTIGKGVFEDNYLTNLTIYNGVTMVGSSAFEDNSLSSLTIPGSVKTIGEYAFSDNLLRSLILKDGVEVIEDSAFDFNYITNVTLSNTLKKIGNSVFSFNYIDNITIPNSVEIIGEYAFEHNYLTEIIIPNSVREIGEYAFGFNEIQNIQIGSGLIDMKANPFCGNTNISSLTVASNNPMYKVVNSAVYTKDGKTLVVGTPSMSNNILNTVTTIAGWALGGLNLTSVTIPNSVTTIEDWAFSWNKLTSVIIPNNVATIGEYAFHVNKITDVTIPSSVKTLKRNAFGSNKLVNVTISNGVETIGNSAFYSNELTNVFIPNSVTTIDTWAFAYNYITNGNAKIDNKLGNVYVNNSAFSNNGLNKNQTITPTYLRN